MSFLNQHSGAGECDLDSLLDATTLEHLRDLVGLGILVSFGRSRDGAAVAVTLYNDGAKRREWFRHDEELHEFLKEAVAALGPSGVKPAAGTKRR